uniref:M23 family metallopeptidase n=1 Tax=uncultured Brachyspira sp. TaxID=221953 RepID=UPI002613DE13
FNDFQDFILKLKEIADNKYNNKLYVYQNKVPIKLEVKYSKDWCDPLDKMEICLFSQGGHYKPWNATFGARQDGHKGVDLFADIGTSVYACLNGKVYYLEGSSEGALMLEVTEPEEIAIFMNRYKEYECIYNGREEGAVKEVNKGINFSMNPTKIVFRYLHLRKRFKQGEYVKKGDIIGESGDEGKNAKNTKGPHVHFEIIDNSINYDIYSLQNLSNKFRAHISAFTKVSYPEKIFNNDLLLQCKEVIGKDTLLSNKKLLRDIASYYRKQVEYLLKKCGNNIQDYLD